MENKASLESRCFPGMTIPAQVPGSCNLLEEIDANHPHLSVPCCYPLGFNYLAGSASYVIENKARNWNFDIIGEDPLLEREKPCSSSELGVLFSLHPSALTSHLDFSNRCLYITPPTFQAPFATCTRENLTLSDNGVNNEIPIYGPRAICGFVTPTTEECTFQLGGMYKEDAVVALAHSPLEDMKTSYTLTSYIQNMNGQLGGYTCDIQADSGNNASYRNQSHTEAAEISSSFHEDTQEFEDLMYLLFPDEDEMSTGHSPSDLTRINALENQSTGSFKRKQFEDYCCEDLDSSEEVESEFKENPSLLELVPRYMNGGIYKSQNSASGMQSDSGSGLIKSNYPSGLYFCAALKDENNAMVFQDKSLSGKRGQITSRKRSRMHEFKTTIEVLRSVIPGGNSTDTVDVLGEAIQYISVLQHKVSELEAVKKDGCGDVTE